MSDKPELLVVDDDPSIIELLSFVLSPDFVVHTARSRPEAKNLLQKLEHPPQLALVDLGLPPMPHQPDEGFRLVGELLACSPAIKIVVFSAHSDEANARRARALGALEFICLIPPSLDKLFDIKHRTTMYIQELFSTVP